MQLLRFETLGGLRKLVRISNRKEVILASLYHLCVRVLGHTHLALSPRPLSVSLSRALHIGSLSLTITLSHYSLSVSSLRSAIIMCMTYRGSLPPPDAVRR